MIKRNIYLNKIIPFIDSEDIKVITGIRRSGKSIILTQIMAELIKKGINSTQIMYFNFESLKYADLLEYKSLYKYIETNISNCKTYFFFDEIQDVNGWEKVVNSLRVDYDCDIYLTGSNSRLLSSELSTYIAGRYVSFTIYPLSYQEVLQFIKTNKLNIKNPLNYYLQFGGFPIIYNDLLEDTEINTRLKDIYSSIVLNDIVLRKQIRNKELLNRLIMFIFDNIGNTFSGSTISKYFKSQNRNVDLETIYNYLNYLEESFIIKKVSRYDIKGKEVLETNEKYYVMDLGIRNINTDYKESDLAGIIENVVYLELLRKEYKVYVGKKDVTEIDFIVEKNSERKYFQVCLKIDNEITLEREIKPLLSLPTDEKKYIITYQKGNNKVKGIKIISLEEFLLSKDI